MNASKKKLFTTSVLLTFLFYTLANGYRSFHTLYAGDSLYMVYQNDAAWEISLGRFVQPFLVLLRGAVTVPFLISALTFLWVSLSVFLVADFLEIRKTVSIALVAAVMSCNVTISSLNATFVSYMDFYTLALFLSVLAVWLMKNSDRQNTRMKKLSYLIAGSLSLSISLGIYQSYICVSIALVMIYFLYKMPEFPSFKKLFGKAVQFLLPSMAAAVVYYVTWRIFQKAFDIWTADSYNGLASIGDYSQAGIGSIIAVAYRNVLEHFIYPKPFITNTFHGISMSLFWTVLIRLCNIAVVLMILLALIKVNITAKTSLWQKIVQLLIVLLFPLGINIVCVISKGMEHALMIYGFYFVYILAIKLTEDVFVRSDGTKQAKSTRVPWMIALSAVAIVSWSNIVYSNQAYLRGNLQENAAQSIMTRIVYSIESREDYVPGITPVAFAGTFENSPCISDAEPLNSLYLYGMGKTTMTYPGTDHALLSYVLNVNMNLTQVNSQDEAILQMPVYPAEGSIAYIDGVLVVKISE
ncbi:MAG: glucosyltransferase domain-containing protein [Blautia sp.]|nr:glucosyltransferase domain-containing protein [Blautia sp.]